MSHPDRALATPWRRDVPKRPWNPARSYVFAAAVPVLFMIVFFALPLAGAIMRSLHGADVSFVEYQRIFSSTTVLRVLAYTLQVAATVALVTLVLAYPVAWMLTELSGTWLHLCTALVLIPFWTSTIIRTYSWIILFQRKGIVNDALIGLGLIDQPLQLVFNSTGMHIGMVHVLLPFMILPLLASMQRIDRRLMLAAAVHGAPPIQQFLQVFLPLSMPGVLSGSLLVFISALGFYVTPALLGGTSNMMVAVLIEQDVSQLLDWPQASALAAMLLIVTGLIFAAYQKLTRNVMNRGRY